MQEQWEKMTAIFNSRGGFNLLELNNGATAEEIAQLEQHTGLELPQAFRNFLSVHNGQEAGNGRGFFFGIRLLSVKEIMRQWDTWLALENDGLNEDLADSMESSPEGVIKPLYLNRKWLPITHDHGGNHIGIDFDPDVKGKMHQIISFGRDEDTKKLKADSFEEFIGKFIGHLESVDWELNAERWDIKDKEYDMHFHDWNAF
jgi:cell wall assembly regulator SMI1